MDNVTHTLAGITMANAFFRDRLGPETVPVLAIASNWPDIDALVMFSRDPAAILMRRTFGHSLILLPFLAAGLAYLLKRFYPRLSFSTLLALCVLGMAVHLLFDLINSFGAVLLWPLSFWRPELGIVFIVDLILAGLSAFPLLAYWPRRRYLGEASRLSMACVAAYFLFCGVNKIWASQILAKTAVGSAPAFSYVFPEPFGPHRWHGVTRDDRQYRVYLIHSLTGACEKKDEILTQTGDPAVEQARLSPFGRKLEWFFKAPVWTVDARTADGVEVSAYDLRFRSLMLPGRGHFKFRMRVHPDGSVERL